MTTGVFFVNKETKKRFQVLAWNKQTGVMKLKGQHSTFSEEYSKERFERLGYVLVREELPEPEPEPTKEDA